MSAPCLYSIVIPVYDEEASLPELVRRLTPVLDRLDGPAEAILVDDGSRDRSAVLMEAIHREDPRFKVLRLSRNFGHQVAISAGLDVAGGEAVVVMDADLQDPPEVVPDLVKRWREGYDVVYALREERRDESWFKRATATVFYRLLRRLTDIEIPANAGDFRLIDRRALEAFRALPETQRFVRGMFAWVGFNQGSVSYVRPGRFAGETKYPFRRMLRLAKDAIISFSEVPLRLALQLGFLVSVGSFGVGVFAIVAKLSGSYTVSGWTSMTVVVAFVGGIQLMVLGVIGEYIARINYEVKRRPLYLVRSALGFGPARDRADRRPLA
jgi:glycosyltransferase involved in cell wall biosynthesis